MLMLLYVDDTVYVLYLFSKQFEAVVQFSRSVLLYTHVHEYVQNMFLHVLCTMRGCLYPAMLNILI
jgi:hypothetical protein